MYYVYILKTSRDTLYTGITNDLKRRITEHTTKSKRAAKYTKAFTAVTLMYTEEVETKSAALKREWEIKQLSRKEKDQLIISKEEQPTS